MSHTYTQTSETRQRCLFTQTAAAAKYMYIYTLLYDTQMKTLTL